jgi:hypothetical protein
MTRATPLPKWEDAASVAALVEEHIAKLRASAGHFAEFAVATRRRDPPRPGQDPEDDVIWFLWEEKAAVKAAERGDLTVLIEILRGPHRDWLQPDTVELVIEFMTGARNPQTGRRKGEGHVGASRMTREQREAKNPIHGAAIEFDAIRKLLERLYPAEPQRKVRKRARELAAERAGVTDGQLYDYLRRARSDTTHRLG